MLSPIGKYFLSIGQQIKEINAFVVAKFKAWLLYLQQSNVKAIVLAELGDQNFPRNKSEIFFEANVLNINRLASISSAKVLSEAAIHHLHWLKT